MPFCRRFKGQMPQILKEERVFVAENFFERKSYMEVQADFENDLIRHHHVKRQSNKTLQNAVHMK